MCLDAHALFNPSQKAENTSVCTFHFHVDNAKTPGWAVVSPPLGGMGPKFGHQKDTVDGSEIRRINWDDACGSRSGVYI